MPRRLEDYWYSDKRPAVLLRPLSALYCAIVVLRRLAYRWRVLERQGIGVPVIVVGNLNVGGTGKTPLVACLVDMLGHAGYRPGVISRGYRGHSKCWPRCVVADSDPGEVGDEPVLLARRCACPVVVSPQRVEAAHELVNKYGCNVIVSDDGLQHYRLARDIEIVVMDGERRLGNGACMPAGPLREPPGRLRSVDFIVGNGAVRDGEYLMTLEGQRAVSLSNAEVSCSLSRFRESRVHAVAGIGNPSRFFRHLREQGLEVLEHPFPDHHRFSSADIGFGDSLPVLMTEKDAVKCETLAQPRFWYVPVEARLDPELKRQLLARLALGARA